MNEAQRYKAILDTLAKTYPDAKRGLHFSSPFELLIATILSAQCTDKRVNQVTQVLFRDYPDAQAIAQMPSNVLENYIHSCGVYKNKARNILATCKILVEQYGGQVPKTMEELTKLPGVGRKTANLILGDIFGKPAIVTDTHCIRLSNRLGFVKNEKDPVKVENALRKLIDPVESSDFCHRLVLFGREHCTARSPKCEGCPLGAVCPSYPIAK